jgi:uncharacterized RDD family membrane protein YckC
MKQFAWCLMLAVVVSIGRCPAALAQTPAEQVQGGTATTPQLEIEPTRRPYSFRQVLRIGQDYTLAQEDSTREVTVIFGDAHIAGHVRHNVLVVLGRAQVESSARIEGALVVIGGQAVAAPGAWVGSDIVVVGGDLDAPPDFAPGGDHVVIGTAIIGGRLDQLVPWLTRGLLWGRPIVPGLPWIWGVVVTFLLVYLAIGLVFNAPVSASATTLATRPLTSFLVGLLVMLLIGPVCVLLAVSVIGIAVIPFVVGAVLIGGIIGRVAAARWIGMRVVPEESSESRLQFVRSFLIGSAAITLVYMVPVLGFLAWTMLGLLGLGGVTLAFMAGYRRENPLPPRRRRAPEAAPLATATEPAPVDPALSNSPIAAGAPSDWDGAVPPAAPGPTLTDLLAYPHAGFLERAAAFALDAILVLIVRQMLVLNDNDGAVFFLMLLAYHVGFWTWKGTTVGGIICQLRLVRADGARLRFVDSLVRGLSAIFSLAVLAIGALWILRDPERQAWHDKIAGTYVVRVPRNFPL